MARKKGGVGDRSTPTVPAVASSKTATDFRICFDRVVSFESSPSRAIAAEVARQEANRMLMMASSRTRSLAQTGPGAIDASGVLVPARAAIVNLKKWPSGQEIRCRFLMGSTFQRKKTQAKAEIWEDYANIQFKFVTKGDAEIRISFMSGQGSWSAVGTDCLVERYFPRYQPTMNFGWLDETTEDREWERVVVHEFGHALGLIHEHQSPNVTLDWNTAEVYRVFSGPPNFWTREQIDFNILQKYGTGQVTASTFDKDSIMLYQFDGRLFLSGQGTPMNYKLSETDKTFIRQMYPKS